MFSSHSFLKTYYKILQKEYRTVVGKLERDFANRMSWWDHKDEDKGCSDDDQECWDLVLYFVIFKTG